MTSTNSNLVNQEISTQEIGFSANASENIGYEKAAKMVKNYHDLNGNVISHFIGKDIIEAILNQPGVVGLAINNGLDQNGDTNLVLSGVDSQGEYCLDITTVGVNGEMARQKGITAIILSTGADWHAK